MPRSARATAVLGLLVAGSPCLAQQSAAAAAYEKSRTKALAEAGQRHLRIGSWARKQGLVPEATHQFMRAVAVSEGQNPGAATVLSYMRSLGDAFWKGERRHPSRALILQYKKRARSAEADTRKDHLELARRAKAADLPDKEKAHYRAVLDLGGTLELDARGVWRLDRKRVPDDLTDWLLELTTVPEQGAPVFEAAGKNAPRLKNLVVHEDDALQVRTDLGKAAAASLHALGTALLPCLQERLDGTPTQRLVLTVFAKRADYEAYLQARGLAEHAAAGGLCDYSTLQTLVSSELPDGTRLPEEDLQALVLHELAHLAFYHTVPAVMPSWYAEGFAESFGGQGTFSWDGKTLTVGDLMRRDRIDAMRSAPIPLQELVDLRASALLARDRDKAHLFYTQCWALQRFLLQEDCPWNARFLWFESKCRGKVLGAPEGAQQQPNPVPASVEFKQLFASDLDKLDDAFLEWLATL